MYVWICPCISESAIFLQRIMQEKLFVIKKKYTKVRYDIPILMSIVKVNIKFRLCHEEVWGS